MRSPDEDLPHKQVTLQEFLDLADEQLFTLQDVCGFVRLVVAGRYSAAEGGPESRLFLNAKQGLHTAEPDEELQVTRDYDSVIGETKDLPYRTAMQVFPVAPFKETLKRDNHMKGLAFDSKVSTFVMPRDSVVSQLQNRDCLHRCLITRSRTWHWGK